MSDDFDRDWTIAPGATLRDWMGENGLGERSAATTCNMWRSLFVGIMDARVPIDGPIAYALWSGTGIPATLWMNLERNYRRDLKAGRKDTTHS